MESINSFISTIILVKTIFLNLAADNPNYFAFRNEHVSCLDDHQAKWPWLVVGIVNST